MTARLSPQRETEIRELVARTTPVGAATASPGAFADVLAELAAVRAERDEARRKVEELACPVCKGSGLDPDDQGDWDGAVGAYNPTTIAPCPTCMGDRTREGGAR